MHQTLSVFERRVRAAKATVRHQLRSLRVKGTVYRPRKQEASNSPLRLNTAQDP